MADRPGGRASPGSLVVVGSGIEIATQLTAGARAAIESSDEVLYLVADSISALRIRALNPSARSLDGFYGPAKERWQTYEEIVEEIVATVLAGAEVCAVLYGHPGILAYPGHEAIARVRKAGRPARMLPAVSALDCLVADLGIDPGRTGFQSYEATHFLERQPPVDPAAALVLWQVGMLGESVGAPTPAVAGRFGLLLARIRELYGDARETMLYEASPYPGCPAAITPLELGDTHGAPAPPVSSMLYVSGR